MSTYTAQNLGARRYQRVHEGYLSGAKLVGLFALAFCIILALFHTPIISLFLGEDSTELAMQTGTGFLKFIGWFFIFIGLKMSTDGVLLGSRRYEGIHPGQPGQPFHQGQGFAALLAPLLGGHGLVCHPHGLAGQFPNLFLGIPQIQMEVRPCHHIGHFLK